MYKFFSDAFFNIIRQILNLILGMLILVLIARELGPQGQGNYSLIILLPGFLTTLFNFGIGVSAAYYIGKQKYSLDTIYKTNIILAFVISFFIVIIGLISIIFLKDIFFQKVSVDILFLALVAVPLVIFKQYMQVIFQGLQDFKPFNLILIIGKVANLIAIFILFTGFYDGLLSAVIAYILGELTSVITAQIILQKKYSLQINKGVLSKEYTKDVFWFGVKTHFTNIMAFLNNRADIFLISYFLTPTYVGLYSVSISISEKLSIVTNSISTVLFPKISSLNNEDERNKITSIVTRIILFISVCGGIILFFSAEWVIYILFGESYLESVNSFNILLLGVILATISRLIANDIAGRGKPELNMYVSFVLVISNIVLNILLIPKYGIVGAAWATTFANFINFLFKICIFHYKFKVPYKEFLLLNKNDIKMFIFVLKKIKGLKT